VLRVLQGNPGDILAMEDISCRVNQSLPEAEKVNNWQVHGAVGGLINRGYPVERVVGSKSVEVGKRSARFISPIS
jgi:hypothetical protein